MPGGETVSSAVKADVKLGLASVDKFPDLILVSDLRDQAAFHQFLVNLHGFVSLLTKYLK
jgi:hypothetical protein